MNFKAEDGTGYDDSNSYVDEAYADAHVQFYSPEDTSWVALTLAQKQLALITSTRFVDSLLRWAGTSLKADQALRWPRQAFKDSDGRTIPAGTIPDKIKQATATLALESLTSDIYDEGVTLLSQKYGDSSETYSGPVRDGGNFYARRFLREFKDSGYGSNKSSLITVQRA